MSCSHTQNGMGGNSPRAALIQVKMQSQTNRSIGWSAFTSSSRSPRWRRRKRFFFATHRGGGGWVSFSPPTQLEEPQRKAGKCPERPSMSVQREQVISKQHVPLHPLPLMHWLLTCKDTWRCATRWRGMDGEKHSNFWGLLLC